MENWITSKLPLLDDFELVGHAADIPAEPPHRVVEANDDPLDLLANNCGRSPSEVSWSDCSDEANLVTWLKLPEPFGSQFLLAGPDRLGNAVEGVVVLPLRDGSQKAHQPFPVSSQLAMKVMPA